MLPDNSIASERTRKGIDLAMETCKRIPLPSSTGKAFGTGRQRCSEGLTMNAMNVTCYKEIERKTREAFGDYRYSSMNWSMSRSRSFKFWRSVTSMIPCHSSGIWNS